MGRWLVIISLTIAQYADIAAAAPPTSGVPLPKPRPVRWDLPAPAAKAMAAPRLLAKPVMTPAVEEPAVQEAPIQGPPTEAPQDRMAAPEAKPGNANGDCTGGKRVISAYYWQGTHTASGQRFDPQAMTAAHRTLPFGTRLTVSNPRSGKSVTVVINDRGPFVSGVSLDLSLGAAQAIGMHGTGAVCIW
jgi:rare lipoprotein A